MQRRAIAILGTVQGVGFRPFVHGLASRLRLDGFVRNQAGGVQIEIEGEEGSLDQFLSQLTDRTPPLARIEQLSWQRQAIVGKRGFFIQSSSAGAAGPIAISPDVATCDQCLAELFDSTNRRYRYPFINCTNCGPRLTIIRGTPYDRPLTTMARFPMCDPCREEYEDPTDRRFHAQPVCCDECGPHLELLDGDGVTIQTDDPLKQFAEMILAGRIGALKGLGGYHLVCDATNPAAVGLLRQRKHRDEKPFAIMVRDVATAERLCEIGREERQLLMSPARPIVLLRKWGENREGTKNAKQREENTGEILCETSRASRLRGCISPLIAPGNPWVGVMLPYTPVHHLLMSAVDRPLVMTSGNRSDEPIAYQEPEAMQRLRGIADVFLTHNRPIHVRCDDSVTSVIASAESPVRRSRGYAPQPITLPIACPAPILAVGGQLKATFALGKDRRAILSHHMGDLDHFQAYKAFECDIRLYEKIFSIAPEYIAHDLHPDYASTRYAAERINPNPESRNPKQIQIPNSKFQNQLIPIQHHQAHIASCMAEHGLTEPVIGVAFDGTGYGLDGAIWGGEFFAGDLNGFQRMAHLRYVPLPGGDAAVRQPWRVAAAQLTDADAACDEFERRQSPDALRLVRQMIQKKLNCPMTSSAGRLFDAMASLCGVRDRVSYEGQAAMQLQWLAMGESPDGAYPFELIDASNRSTGISPMPSAANIGETPMLRIDTRPMIRAIVADVGSGVSPGRIARRFHSTLVDLCAEVCDRLQQITGISNVALSGGVFMNALFAAELEKRLNDQGFRVYRHCKVPPNDAGLCLGQLALAANQIHRMTNNLFESECQSCVSASPEK